MTNRHPGEIALRAARHVDTARLLGAIESLARFGARGDGGVDRPTLSGHDLDARRHLIERAHALGCARRHRVTLQTLFSHVPLAFDPSLLARLGEAADALGARTLALTSSAFHDAIYLARHCPTAMLFVPSRDGISHNPLKHTDDEHLVLGTRALAHCLATLCNTP